VPEWLLGAARLLAWATCLVLLANMSSFLLLHDGWFFTSPADLGMRPGYLRTPLLWALGAGLLLAALYWRRLQVARRDWLSWALGLSMGWLLLTLVLTSGGEGYLLPLRLVLGLGVVMVVRGWSRRRRARAT
jgi:peptidoglycan/LPS O-acetylase OafA/YrhL